MNIKKSSFDNLGAKLGTLFDEHFGIGSQLRIIIVFSNRDLGKGKHCSHGQTI